MVALDLDIRELVVRDAPEWIHLFANGSELCRIFCQGIHRDERIEVILIRMNLRTRGPIPFVLRWSVTRRHGRQVATFDPGLILI